MCGSRFRSGQAHGFDVCLARHKRHRRQVAVQRFDVPFDWCRQVRHGRFSGLGTGIPKGLLDSKKSNSDDEKKKKREGKIKGTGTPASPDLRFSLSAHGVRESLSGTLDFCCMRRHFSGVRVFRRF